MAAKIQFRRDTSSNWSSVNPTLAAGEMGYDTTNDILKIGDGSTAWNSLTSSNTFKNSSDTVLNADTTTVGMSFVVDEDNMASNLATKVPTQQSVKAYVDTQVATVPVGDITSVVAGTGLTGGATSGAATVNVIGGTGITANADDIAIDSTVTTLTGTQTLTNKTLTSPVLNTGVSGTAFLDEDNMVSNSATKIASQQSIKAYVDTQVATKDALSELSGTLDDITDGTTYKKYSATEKTKLAGIEASATADQTNAEIKTAYEANADTNEFSDAEQTKLAGIEASATADQTNAEIRTAVEAATNSNVFTDADHTKLNAIEAAADVTDTTNVVAALTAGTNIAISAGGTVSSTDTNTTYSAGTGITLTGTTFAAGPIALTTVQVAANQTAQLALTAQEGDVAVRSDEKKSYMHNGGSAGTMADWTELQTPTDSVLSVNGNTGAITAAQIATAVEAASDSNTFTDADHTKLNAIEASATADQTNAEIVAAVEAGTDSNTFTDADHTKLNAIEASATADQTAAQIKTAYESNSDTNAYNDAAVSKLAAIEASATADQTSEEIQDIVGAMVASNTETGITVTYQDGDGTLDFAVASQTANDFTNALKTKLDAIEASADVTDTANVVSALSAGTGVAISGAGAISVTAVALTTVQTAANQTAHLALTAQEGDIVVRSDENKTYCHNGGTAGTMADYTLLATPTDTVLSVNGDTGAVTVTHDGLSDFVANEHIDWTSDQGSTNIHSGNYTDTDTTYTASTGITLAGTTFSVTANTYDPAGEAVALAIALG
jgi:hypothetical protein